MKSFLSYFGCILFIFNLGCKTDKKNDTKKDIEQVSILEKIANAHGYKSWKNVTQIAFTFNVDRDTTHYERSWVWNPKTNDVTHVSNSDSLRYNRKNMDSIAYKTNAGFINDRYWLLAPFNLIWDEANFTYTHTEAQISPVSQKPMHKLTIVYKGEGGYTPGDAYDFYFENDYLIREWVFRKGNQAEPSLITTWENYVDHNGFLFAMEHKKPKENFNIFFDELQTAVK